MGALFEQDSINVRERLNELECLPEKVAQNTQTLLPLQAYTGKNLLINSDKTVSQRGDYSSPVSVATGDYWIDRYRVSYTGGQGVEVSVVNGWARIEATTTGSSFIANGQRVEPAEVFKGRMLTYTAEFKANCPARLRLRFETLASSVDVYSEPHSGDESIKLISITTKVPDDIDLTSVNALQALTGTFYGGPIDTIAGDYVSIGREQLEFGSEFSGFEYVPPAINLTNCQRYYYRETATTALHYFNTLQAYAADKVFGKLIALPVTMRDIPVVAISDVSHFKASLSQAGSTTTTVLPTFRATQNSIQIDGSEGFSGLVAGNASMCGLNTIGAWIEADAEL